MDQPHQSQRKTDTCKLCGLRQPLRRSHILPSLAYKDVIDRDSHPRMIVVRGLGEQAAVDTSRQTGFWEWLLCDECEQMVSELESYASRRLLNVPLPEPNPVTGLIQLKVDDYAKLKLFFLSLLWRVGVAQGDFFRCVDLGPHELRLREMLQTRNPGEPGDYGCLVTPLLPEPGVAMDRVVLMPMMTRLGGVNGCLLVFRRFVFQYFISRHRISPGVRQSFLNKDGEMLMLRVRGAVFPPIRELWRRCINDLREKPGKE